MAAPEVTPEMKNDLKLMKYSKVLSNDKFFKNEDRRGAPKFFQMGRVMDSSEDFYSNRRDIIFCRSYILTNIYNSKTEN